MNFFCGLFVKVVYKGWYNYECIRVAGEALKSMVRFSLVIELSAMKVALQLWENIKICRTKVWQKRQMLKLRRS